MRRAAPGLVGRETLLAQLVAAWLPAGGIWNLSGLSGVGKTALAAEASRRCAAAFPDGVFWLRCGDLARDESASPEQMVDFVIRGREVLGITDTGPLPMPVSVGDLVCFYIAGTGIVGHAQFDNGITDASGISRGAGRFTAVFQLKDVAIYDAPHRVMLESIGLHVPSRSPYDNGAMLAPITREDYEALTIEPPDQARGRLLIKE